MEALSRREEQDIMESAKSQALKLCDDAVREFADCATGRTFSLPFVCKSKLDNMHICMRSHMTEDRLDAMKLDYIAHRSEKGKEAVEALRKSRAEKLRRMAGLKEEARPS